jgi:hypothetical protein
MKSFIKLIISLSFTMISLPSWAHEEANNPVCGTIIAQVLATAKPESKTARTLYFEKGDQHLILANPEFFDSKLIESLESQIGKIDIKGVGENARPSPPKWFQTFQTRVKQKSKILKILPGLAFLALFVGANHIDTWFPHSMAALFHEHEKEIWTFTSYWIAYQVLGQYFRPIFRRAPTEPKDPLHQLTAVEEKRDGFERIDLLRNYHPKISDSVLRIVRKLGDHTTRLLIAPAVIPGLFWLGKLGMSQIHSPVDDLNSLHPNWWAWGAAYGGAFVAFPFATQFEWAKSRLEKAENEKETQITEEIKNEIKSEKEPATILVVQSSRLNDVRRELKSAGWNLISH